MASANDTLLPTVHLDDVKPTFDVLLTTLNVTWNIIWSSALFAFTVCTYLITHRPALPFSTRYVSDNYELLLCRVLLVPFCTFWALRLVSGACLLLASLILPGGSRLFDIIFDLLVARVPGFAWVPLPFLLLPFGISAVKTLAHLFGVGARSLQVIVCWVVWDERPALLPKWKHGRSVVVQKPHVDHHDDGSLLTADHIKMALLGAAVLFVAFVCYGYWCSWHFPYLNELLASIEVTGEAAIRRLKLVTKGVA